MNKRKKLLGKLWIVLAAGFMLCQQIAAQMAPADTLSPYRNIAAAPHHLPLLAQKTLVGQRYRLEWAMPVRVPVALLDTLAGGLRLSDVQQNDSFATYALQAYNANGETYSLTPVIQSVFRSTAGIYQNTFISDFAADLQSAYHPYAPLVATALARAAGLSSNALQLLYLPQQKALGTYNRSSGNQLYYLQRLPVAANPDTSASWVSTSRLLQLLEKDNRNSIDAALYLQYRLLDMLLGVTNRDGWGWRWLAQPAATGTNYIPVPQGYESAFPLYEGKMVSVAKIVAPIRHLVSFGPQMPDPKKLNEKALHLDRRFTAGLDEEAWKKATAALRAALTDEAIQNSMAQMPEAVRTLSGKTIEAKLKSRRNELEAYAQRYYRLLATNVDILASGLDELIKITGKDSGNITVNIYPLAADSAAPTPFFNRTFRPSETKEINLYGIGGQDRFDAEGNLAKKIKLRIIGGPDQDSLRNRSRNGTLLVYDNAANNYAHNSHSRYHLRNDAEVHRYDFDVFAFDKKGLQPMLFYNNNDRLYVGLAYGYTKQGWRKSPYAQRHKAYLNYSILQGGVSAGYEGVFNQIIGRWNGLLSAEFDAIRWNNFFGIGNESPQQVLDNNFHRIRSEILSTDVGLFRPLGRHHSIGVTGRFQTVRIRPDMERIAAKTLAPDDLLLFRTHQYAGATLTYTFSYLNNPLLPTKGLLFNASSGYTKNIKTTEREVMNYATSLQFYIPLATKLVWTSVGGLQAVTGKPEFYQLATIGGTATLRGYRRERFWGKTVFYNQNELQYLMPVRSYSFNGTVGLSALFDAGRVWQPGEQSDKLHTGYGAGLLLAPFHKLLISVAYARSAERGIVHIGFRGRL